MAAVNMIYKGSYVPLISQGSKQQKGQTEQNSLRARCEVLPALLIKMLVFWDVMPCQLLKKKNCLALCRRYRQPTNPDVASYVPIDVALYPRMTGSSRLCLELQSYWMISPRSIFILLTFRHRASCILGKAFHYSPENTFLHINQQIYFIM